ncbi:MAG: accessory Sec system translocase SecA2 [Rhodoglobus sp.]
MSRQIPRWFSRALGLPGAVSFRRYDAYVRAAHGLADEVSSLLDEDLATRAATLDMRTGGPLSRDATIKFLAIAREAAARTTGLRAFDEQLLASCALLSGHAVEMDTGEGKTLVGALAAAGHVLSGRRVHVLSVNDYLAERDAEWMRSFFELLGLSVGWIGQHSSHAVRQEIYRRDVVYASVSEVGFDVLRDRFAVANHDRVDPVFDAAIVDEADAVMIDEAMVPLVLAGTADGEADDFAAATTLVDSLVYGRDYQIDDDQATVTLTDEGLDQMEASLGGLNLYASENIAMLTRINLALHARVLVRRDVDYLVEDGSIKLINAGRGRVAHLQRWPDGLHAAIEAKEQLSISAPGVILDSITIQDLLLSYRTLSGMSGTVLPVAEDLLEFYKLPAGRVERHLPNHRIDLPNQVFVTQDERDEAIVSELVSRHATGQPVLLGTRDVAESESIAVVARRQGMEPRVLNAKNDADEAAVIARAGEYSAVTISTQMSGRGTDIRLGGADETERDRVISAGGLVVIGTGRYPSQRLDAQLRGRAGRQGDPGTSITLVSLDDAVVRANAPAHLLTEIAQHGATLASSRRRYIVNASQQIAEAARLSRHRATWMYNRAIAAQRKKVLDHRREIAADDLASSTLRSLIPAHYAALEDRSGTDVASTARAVVLYYLDDHWMQHLALLQDIRDGIHLRALAGQKPADEFHAIALREFHGFLDAVYRDAARFLETLNPYDIGLDLEKLGLRRPSATWTYMVSDDPFGSPGDRLARELGKRWRTRILRIE